MPADTPIAHRQEPLPQLYSRPPRIKLFLAFLLGIVVAWAAPKAWESFNCWMLDPPVCYYEGMDTKKRELSFSFSFFYPTTHVSYEDLGLNDETAPIVDAILKYNENVRFYGYVDNIPPKVTIYIARGMFERIQLNLLLEQLLPDNT